jgi:ubiquinone/menaquinone biosynthesis C-methylase UbiE
VTTEARSIPESALRERFGFLHEAVAAACALAAADELGVLAQLDAGVQTVPVLAQNCSLDERGARMLLSALAGMGLVEAGEAGSYHAVLPDLSRLARLMAPWAGLADVIRQGRPALDASSAEAANKHYPDVVPCLGAMQADMAELAADYLFTPGARVLDVGAGAAPWSLALAKRDPGCRVTAVDMPAVLAVTRRAAIAAGCDGQYEYVAGDVFSLELGSYAYDLIILGNLCHLFDEESNERLLAKLSGSLAPQGRLAILDLLLTERLDGPRWVVLYALGLLLRTTHGQPYPFSAYTRWLRAAGFTAIKRKKLIAQAPISLITAQV